MAKIYSKNTWVDEVLAGSERYNILEDDGTPVESAVQINLSTAVAVAGSAVDADKMNNIEDGIDALDTLVSDGILTSAQRTDLTDGGETTLHTHAGILSASDKTDLTDGGTTTLHIHAMQLPGDELTLLERRDNRITLFDGFDGASLPAGFSWAGSPFATPSTVDLTNRPSMVRIYHTGSIRAFVQSSTLFSSSIYPLVRVGWSAGASTSFIGLRLDDGSDNNYFESLLSGDLKVTCRTRVGGGAVTTNQGSALVFPTFFDIAQLMIGTRFSNWYAQAWFSMPGQGAFLATFQAASAITNASWTPTRWGILYECADAGRVAHVDAIYTTS